jgi:hypothetical protein
VLLREQDRKDVVAADERKQNAQLMNKEFDFRIEQEKSKTKQELISTQGQLEESKIRENYTKRQLTEAEKRNNVLTTQFEKLVHEFTDLKEKWKDSFMEVAAWKMNCLLLGFAGCFGYIVTTQIQSRRKNYMIGPQYLIPKMQSLIVMGINNGNIVQVYNPETGTKNYWTNQATIDQLSAALGAMVGNIMLQAASIGNNNNNNDGNGAGALGYDPSMRSSSGALGYDPGMRRRGGRKTRRLKKLKKINNKTR